MSRLFITVACSVSLLGCRPNVVPGKQQPVILGVVVETESEIPVRAAASAIEREVRAAGGMLGGRDLEVHVGAYADPALTTAMANGFIMEGASAMVGPTNDNGTLIMLQSISYAVHMPHFSVFQSTPAYATLQPPSDRYLVLMTPSNAVPAAHLANVLKPMCTKFLITANPGSLTVHGPPFQQAAQAAGIDTTMFGAWSTFDDPIYLDALKMGGYDCIMMLASLTDLEVLVPSFEAVPGHQHVRWVLPNEHGQRAEFFDAVGDNTLVDGMIVLSPVHFDQTTPEYRAFDTQLAAVGASLDGEGQTGTAAVVYDALALAALAVQANGSTTPSPSLRDQIPAVSGNMGSAPALVGPQSWELALSTLESGLPIDYQGATGTCNINPNLTYDRPRWILEYHASDDSWEVLDTVPAGM